MSGSSIPSGVVSAAAFAQQSKLQTAESPAPMRAPGPGEPSFGKYIPDDDEPMSDFHAPSEMDGDHLRSHALSSFEDAPRRRREAAAAADADVGAQRAQQALLTAAALKLAAEPVARSSGAASGGGSSGGGSAGGGARSVGSRSVGEKTPRSLSRRPSEPDALDEIVAAEEQGGSMSRSRSGRALPSNRSDHSINSTVRPLNSAREPRFLSLLVCLFSETMQVYLSSGRFSG